MDFIRPAAAVLLVALACYIVILNWAGVVTNVRNKRRKIDRHVSTVPIVSLVLTWMAASLWPGEASPT